MPTLDTTAKAALASPAFAAAHFVYLDITGDPLRFTTFGANTVVASSGDAELDGTYPAFGGRLIDISDVSNSESGSDTLTVTLSGIVNIDTALLAEMGDRTKWQGRVCRIWFRLYDANGVTPQGAIAALYTGYMSSLKINAGSDTQTIQLNVENWLAAFNQPSNRSYLNQKDYDSADNSAAATIAASNGQMKNAGGTTPPAGVLPGISTGIGGGGAAGGGLTGGGLGGSYGSMGSDGASPVYEHLV